MAVKFIFGPAGAGKTKYCFDQIAESIRQSPLGPPIFWLVPRQATFIAERQLACAGGGYFRVRILDFIDFAAEVLGECGGAAVPEITDRGRRMILGHILRQSQGQLQFFKSVATQPGVAAELDATFAELHRAGQDASALPQQLHRATPALKAKLHDLSIIFSQYIKFLGQDRIDPNRRLAESLASIHRCPSLRQADVFVDSFYEFTASERKLLAALAKVCRSMSIALTLDAQSPVITNPHHMPDEMSLFHPMELTYKRLFFAMQEASVEMTPPILLQQTKRFHRPELAHLERALVSPVPAISLSNPPAIDLINAPDFQTEVDSAARWIRRLVAAGLRYRDIVVLMRTQDDYQPLIEASFREHGIPFFADRRRSASHHPLLRLIRSVLAIANTNWSHDAMMATLKTSLVGLSQHETDALENYVLLHGIDHTAWISPNPWTGRRARSDESDPAPITEAQAMDALRRPLVDRLIPFITAVKQKSASVQSIASALFQLLEAFQCRTTIVQWMDQATAAGRLEEAGEHERVWDELVKLFDELVDLFVAEPINLKHFSSIIDAALEGFDLALAPPTVDQVLVGSVDRTRTPPVKACAILGLSEGQFPRASAEDSIFTDADRNHLEKSNINLDPDSARRLLDENFLGYIALTRASERLLLTRIASDPTGRALDPSPVFQRVRSEFPTLRDHPIPRSADLPLNLIATPRQLVGSLMKWVEQGATDPAWEPVYQWLAAHPTSGDALDTARFHAWKALSHCNNASLEPAHAAALFPSPLRATSRQLESYRRCPYQHFARHGLGLTPRQHRQAGPADLSNIFHEALSRLVRDLTGASRSWQDLTETEIASRLNQFISQIGSNLRDALMLSSARNRYLLAHVEKTLALVAATQKAAAQRGKFKPAMTGIAFGDKSTDAMPPLSITTPAGKQLLVSGKIDRIDLLPDGSASLIDYRLSTHAMDPAETYHGLYLELLIDLLALEKNGQRLAPGVKLTPVAAFCVQLARFVRKANPVDAPGPSDPAFHLLVKPRGIFDLAVARDLDNALTTGPSEVIQLHIKQDGSIGHPDHSDAAASDEFAALLRHVEQRIGRMVDEITAGRIDIRPYRHGIKTPCPHCEFRDLCRLEPSPGCYDDLQPIKRSHMLQQLVEKMGKTS